jgi:hypothetical protein
MAHAQVDLPEGQWCPACSSRLVLEAFSPSSRGKQGKPCAACSHQRSYPFARARRVALKTLGDRYPDEYRALYVDALSDLQGTTA